MAKRLILFLILFLSVNSIAAIHVAVLETIAEKDVIGQSEKLFLTDKLRERAKAVLPAHMGFTVMTRENINAMLPPGKSIEECEGSCLVETGKNIAADYVAQARVGKFGDQLTLTLELYETAGNNLVESFTTRKPNAEGLLEEIEQNQADRVFVQIVKAVETSGITKEETKSSKEKAPKQKKTSTETPANKVSSNLGEMVDKRNGKKYSHGRLVAELTLGFWVALMGRKYNTQSFQFAIIKNCLHGCPSHLKKSSAVQRNLAEIRFLRNRIAHHERICHWKDLQQKHDLLLDFICWLNADMHKIALRNDTFNNVYKNGITPFLDFVQNEL